MTQFKGKNVLITGGASGLGRLLAIESAKRNASNIILVDINEKGLEETKNKLEEYSCNVSHFKCDLSNREEVYVIGEKVINEYSCIDILILNAGIVQAKTILESDDNLTEKTFFVNAISNFWMAKIFLPPMIKKNEGHVVTVSSISAFATSCKIGDYGASKGASFSFNEALRLELSDMGTNIKTTVMCPYYMDTGMFKGSTTKFPFILPILKPEDVCKKLVRGIEKNKESLITPLFCYTIFLVRFFPAFVGDWIHRFLGINKSMKEFVGRQKK